MTRQAQQNAAVGSTQTSHSANRDDVTEDVATRRMKPAEREPREAMGDAPPAIPLHLLRRGKNVRRTYDKKKLEELAASIEENGVLQPPTVRPLADGLFELMIGGRRLAAFEHLHAKDPARFAALPCQVVEMSDADIGVLQLVENLQREDMTADEIAEAMVEQAEASGHSARDLAKKLSLSERMVQLYLKVGRAPAFLRAFARGVDVEVKKKAADGTTETETARKPGLELQKLVSLVRVYDVLFAQDEKYKAAPGYKLHAERVTSRLAQRAAAEEWTRSELERHCAEALRAPSSDGAEASSTTPKRQSAYRITSDSIRIDIKRLATLGANERRLFATRLIEALGDLAAELAPPKSA